MNRKIAIALGGAALLTGAPAYADGLIENVNGITLDKDGRTIHFTGILIGDDGKVKQLLAGKERPATDTRNSKKRKKDQREPVKSLTFTYDGKGRTLLPGFIDAHGHVTGLGFNAMMLDLSDATSLDDALARIQAYAAKNPDAPWILGRGWNQEKWGLNRFPTAAELDRVTGGRPAWLVRVDGHAGWANSRAMQLAGVTGATKEPAGGKIDMAGGKPAGVFVDGAMALVSKDVPQPSARDYDRALQEAQALLLQNGITTATDMGTTVADWNAYRRAGDLGQLRIRILSYAHEIDDMAVIGGPRPTPWLYNDKLRMVGVKLYLDGALGSRGAWLKAPYSDAPGNSGLPLLSYSQLRNKLVRASMDKFQVAIHAIGDKANDDVLEAIESVAGTYPDDRRWRVEHAQIVDPADIARFGRHGTIASMQPVHETSDRVMAETRLGAARLAGAYAWRSIGATGARLAFGSDFPVESPNPLAGFAAAISREDASGQPPGGWQPQEKVTREIALDGFTRTAAFAAFAEDRLGILAPGMRADFVILDVDPMQATPQQIWNGKVLETWIDGRPAWQAGRVTFPTPDAPSPATPKPQGPGR